MIHPIVGCMRENPHQQFTSSLYVMAHNITTKDKGAQTAFINGFLMGVCLQEAWKKNSEPVRAGMIMAIDVNKANRGENVVSFLDEKARKR